MRYRLFPARLGIICCEPFEGEIGSDKTNGVTSATARQHHSKAAARSRRELKGSDTMAYQTVTHSPEVISWGSKVARVNARPPQHI
jgi:hypothetical protein